MPELTKRDDNIASRSFLRGLAVIAFLYAGGFAYISSQSDNTLNALEESFPFRVALIERASSPAPLLERYIYPPAPSTSVEQSIAAPSGTIVASDSVPQSTEQVQIDVTKGALKPSPIEGMYEDSAQGKLPKVSADGLTPFDAYKRPFSYRGTPVIALALRDFGLSATASDLAIALPPEITLILSPYASDPDLWQKKAREAGHEVWISLPMQNQDFLSNDTGSLTLMVNSTLSSNADKLKNLLARTTGYAGVISFTDRTFMSAHVMLSEILSSVFSRGLAYAELNPAGSGLIETLAAKKGAPYLQIQQDIDLLDTSFAKHMEERANESGFFVGTLPLTPRNIESLRIWSLNLTGRDITLAPLSAVAAGRVPKKSAPRSTGIAVEESDDIHH